MQSFTSLLHWRVTESRVICNNHGCSCSTFNSETSGLSGNTASLSNTMHVPPMVASMKLSDSGLCVCVNSKL